MSPRATIAELFALLLAWGIILSFIPGCDQKAPVVQGESETPASATAGQLPSQMTGDLPAFQSEAGQLASTPAAPGAYGGGSEPDEQPRLQVAASAKTSPRAAWADRPTRAINERAIAAAGLHRLAGQHLTLYTDLPVDEELKALPQVFDLAFAQWCQYFDLDPAKYANWQMRGVIIGDKAKFAGTDLLPASLPAFRNGFAREGELWLYEQPSVYYRRHLLLHEGTHGFMDMLLGGSGPAWYMEGMAELLATHTWSDGQLTLNVMPTSKEAFEMLGRIKIVQEGTAQAGQAKSLTEILNYSNRAHLENEPYGWCWALAAFLDRHPKYQARFRELPAQVNSPQFNANFAKAYEEDAKALHAEWQLFASTLEHGHDLSATAIDFTPGEPLMNGARELTIDAARGWQSSGVQLLPKQKYRLTATGRYQVALTTEPWMSEANGVTIRYYRGQPLGILQAAVIDLEAATNQPNKAAQQLVSPITIGLGSEISSEQGGMLYLQVNDSAGERADNIGTLKVTIAAE